MAVQNIASKFGYTFMVKREQVRIIEALMDGKDVFAALPTGYGKSLTFTLLPAAFEQVKFVLLRLEQTTLQIVFFQSTTFIKTL